MWDLIFPFRRVARNSKVVLFGAGKRGSIFWRQNENVRWCDICLVVDSNHLKKKDFPVQVSAPEDIYKLTQFDYIIITALSDKARNEIYNSLRSNGIPSNKIIEGEDYYYEGGNFETIIYTQQETNKDDTILKIGLEFMNGGIGDYVILLKFYQELVKLAPESEIDLLSYFSFISKSIVESIMYRQKNIRNIKSGLLMKDEYSQYDVVIHLDFEPRLLWMDYTKVIKFSLQLAKKMEQLYEYQKKENVDFIVDNTRRIIMDKSKMCGWNRYTVMGVNHTFEISDQYSRLYINNEFESEYKNLKLNIPYITFNYGANNKCENKHQTKEWPFQYHAKLNKMLKERFPDIEIIQVGGNYVEKVPGADRYILGMHLDVVKQILKNAILHFDSEGGLVHLATQLGTKCFVVFGPTPVWFFGYDRNVNIEPKSCGECMGLTKEWQTKCYLYDKPECMYSILPEYVFQLLESYLVERNIT